MVLDAHGHFRQASLEASEEPVQRRLPCAGRHHHHHLTVLQKSGGLRDSCIVYSWEGTVRWEEAIRQEGKEGRSKKKEKRLWKYNIKGGGNE